MRTAAWLRREPLSNPHTALVTEHRLHSTLISTKPAGYARTILSTAKASSTEAWPQVHHLTQEENRVQIRGGKGRGDARPRMKVWVRDLSRTPGRRGSVGKDLVSPSAEALWGADSSEENQV